MKLYSIKGIDLQKIVGDPFKPKAHDLILMGQMEDCSEFLVQSNIPNPVLVEELTIPTRFIFTYCQAWGLTVTKEVLRRARKEVRDQLVAKLVVSSGSLTVNADEKSQERMARAIITLDDTMSIPWVLADNSTANITKSQFVDLLLAARTAQTALWVAYQ